MMDTIAVIFGMTFVGVIAEVYAPNNKLEQNIKKFDKKTK